MYAHFRVAPNATSGLLGGNLVIEVTAEGTIEKPTELLKDCNQAATN